MYLWYFNFCSFGYLVWYIYVLVEKCFLLLFIILVSLFLLDNVFIKFVDKVDDGDGWLLECGG